MEISSIEYMSRIWQVCLTCIQRAVDHPEKNICITLILYNVGPILKTLGRSCTNVIQMFRVCWRVQLTPLCGILSSIFLNDEL